MLSKCFYCPIPVYTGKQEAVSDWHTLIGTALRPSQCKGQLPGVWVWKAGMCGAVITWGLNNVNHASRCLGFWSYYASVNCRILSGKEPFVLSYICWFVCVWGGGVRIRSRNTWGLQSMGARKSWPIAFLSFSATSASMSNPESPNSIIFFLIYLATPGPPEHVSRGPERLVL